MKFFGSSGIRGLVNEKITPELAMKVGRAVARDHQKVIIGRDPRPTGKMVSSSIKAGLTAEGADVWDAGMVATPTLAYAAKNFDCGVMVTASHNPAPYNGIKLWNPDGSSFNTPQMERTEEQIMTDTPLPGWEQVGDIRPYRGATKEHTKSIMNIFGKDHTTKVAVDCANGAGCRTTPFLLRKMGCQVVTMNSQPDGTFPAHDPEPTEQNLADLGKLVKKTNADLGIAHDGDADRLVAFDDRGNYLGGDKLLALFASQFTEKVVVPINSSMVIEELVDEVIRTKVGDVFVAEQLKNQDAQFGGEASGTWIFPEMSYAPDAIYAAAFLVDLSERIDITKKIEELPFYPQERKSYEVEEKERVMKELKNIYQNRYSLEKLDFTDGIRVEHESGWSLTRRSGTEPKIRITVEARTQEDMDDIFKRSETLLKEVTG